MGYDPSFYEYRIQQVCDRFNAASEALRTNQYASGDNRKFTYEEFSTDDDYLLYLMVETDACKRRIENKKPFSATTWSKCKAYLTDFHKAAKARLSPEAKEKYKAEDLARRTEEQRLKQEKERDELRKKIESFCGSYAAGVRKKEFKYTYAQLLNARQEFRDNVELSKYKKGLFGVKYLGDYLSFDPVPMIERMKKANKL